MEDNTSAKNDKAQLDLLIKNMCILIHTELESIGDFQPTESLSNILSLTSFQALDFISNTIELALAAKQKAKENSCYSEFLNDESYQKEMQKLENEIRNHIKIEQQMKLYADALEEKSEQMETIKAEKKKSLQVKLDSLKAEKKALTIKVAALNKELVEVRKNAESGNVGASKLKHSDIDKKISRAEHEHGKVTKALADIDKEYAQQKKDNEDLKNIMKELVASGREEDKEKEVLYKSKFEQKCAEIEYMKKKIRTAELLHSKGNRSITPKLNKTGNMQSQRTIKRVNSNEKIKSVRIEKIPQRVEQVEKKRLPLSFTARK